MDFLYEEIDATEKSQFTAHLKSCHTCERQLSAWRGTMTSLDQWPLPAARKRFSFPVIRWAAAAAIFLAVGVLIGKAVQPTPNRAELQSLRAQLAAQQQRIDELAGAFAEARVKDRQTMFATLRELENRRGAEFRNLRNDLETVATLTQEGFVSLAGYNGQP